MSNRTEPKIAPDLAPLRVSIACLEPMPGNPRRGDVDAVARSYAQFGQRKPIVARRTSSNQAKVRRGVVIAGNHQLAAAKVLGWDELAVVWTDDDDATAKAFALADNRTADLGSYDDVLLAEVLQAVQEFPDLAAATGYSDEDLAALLASATPGPPVGKTDPDVVPDPPAPRTVAGDLWVLGPHRVLCGDSTVPTDVEKVMGGGVADVVWTDPPYGIDYVAMRRGDKIANDAGFAEAESTMRASLANAGATVAFVCCNWRSLPVTIGAMVDVGLEPKACVVWDKGSRVQNLDRFAKQHEFMLYAGPFGGEPTVDVDVWTIARDFDPDHPTPKPVDLIARSLRHAAGPNTTVIDPFGGSGSTLIAAHSLNRRAFLIEKDERYVDVICRRFQEHTGIVPINEATGRQHDFTADADR